MKKSLVEATLPPKTQKMGWWIIPQPVKDVLILNIFNNRVLQGRHCINVITHEFMTWRHNQWFTRRIEEAMKLTPIYGYYYSTEKVKARFNMSEENKKLIMSTLKTEDCPPYVSRHPYDLIDYLETKHGQKKRETTEMNRFARVQALMDGVPPVPGDLQEFINQREIAGEDYATKTERKGIFACSGCGEKFSESKLKRVDGEKKVRHNDMVICPACGKHIKIVKRKKAIDILTHFALVQPIDDSVSVVRHFDAVIYCGGGKKQIGLDEAVRIILHKQAAASCTLYYNQNYLGHDWIMREDKQVVFDNKSNRANRSEYAGYLYDGGIVEAFEGTHYYHWSRLFSQMAAAGIKVNYNKLMCSTEGMNFVEMVEMLFKNRFHRLLGETSECVSVWNGAYTGLLRMTGYRMEDVFGIADRQKINRIRDNNGGGEMLKWMRWSELRNKKIPDKVLKWLIENKITSDNIAWLSCRMSLEQMMNYIERQRRESYKGWSARQVIYQYEDYMNMCQKLKKDTTDEMVYRPRELRRRHDEAVKEVALRQSEIKADEYSRRFPGAEDVLQEIKPRYDYENEEYMIYVPKRLVEIVEEGRALHHCAGSSDRYFDRIMQRETYICLLRKKTEPDKPYYTIEVEPSGTIRQHRGYLDEEPEIELVKPFLREWQQVIKKRLTENDRKYAAISAVKREENIAELKAKNNTRVLEGLMEDFMEAVI